MQKWLKQNLNLGVIIILIGLWGAGAAWAALTESTVARLDKEVFGRVKDKTMGERLVSIETTLNAIARKLDIPEVD